MGLFDIFKKKEPIKPEVKISVSVPTSESIKYQQEEHIREVRWLEKKSVPSKNGLRPHEIFMLSYAPRYNTAENRFPQFWHYEFGIDDPQSMLCSLCEKGFIRESTASESLENLKVPDLKELLSELGQKTSGKKADLIARIRESSDENYLSGKISGRYFVLTPLGQQELNENKYVTYFGSSIKYGMTVWDMNKMLGETQNPNYRDVIWGELNRQTIESAKKMADGEFSEYILNRKQMCSFLIEEERNHEMAFRLLCEATFYDFNIESVNRFCRQLPIEADLRKMYQKGVLKDFFPLNIHDYFIVDSQQFQTLQKELNLSDSQFEEYLIEVLKCFHAPSIFLPHAVLAKLIVAETSENGELRNEIYAKMESDLGAQ